ncbi:MAG: glycoside hydrolase family 43 protein [Rhizobacter sp.]|nr:glycoside hydrolase family 43 protein [Rhizobacter sp.]
MTWRRRHNRLFASGVAARLGRRALRAVLACAFAAHLVGAAAASFVNPIVAAHDTGAADPSVVFHRGYFYYCRAVGDTAIGIARARRLQDIGAAPLTIVFRAPPGTPYSRQLWAPELQRIRGRWFIHFAASDGDNAHHRMYALAALEDDPQGRWELKGRVADATDGWAIDGVVLELGHRLYFVWSGWPSGNGGFPQLLYIAAMRDPWTIVGARHAIAAPELDWERAVAPLLESPEPLRHGGSTFIVYSAAASWSDEYALGVLRYVGGDPLGAASWRKEPGPAFAGDLARGVFGVGHPSFVRSPDGREHWIVYHAIDRAGGGWSARSVRAQRFGWCGDTPSFGAPVPPGVAIEEPSGTPGRRVAHEQRATMRSPCR